MHFRGGRIFLWEGSRNENIDVFMNERRIKNENFAFFDKENENKMHFRDKRIFLRKGKREERGKCL